jgi:phosphoglycerate kinase
MNMKSSLVHLVSALHAADLNGLRVLLRADLNVPTHNGRITSDHRLAAVLPTIKLIRKKGGHIILATHMGRPKKSDPAFSTRILVPWFEQHGLKVTFEPDLERAQELSKKPCGDILLLENLRFFPGEQEKNPTFAQSLANLADYYVNDAFGLLHRNDASITDVPALFARNKRTIGLLIEQELMSLNSLLEEPQHPFVLILGGAKIKDKLPLLQAFLPVVDTILLCPASVFTFLKAQGKPVGKSLVDDTLLDASRQILAQAHKQDVRVLFPVDYQIAQETFDGTASFIDSTNIPNNAVGVSIGPKTEVLFAQEIEQAHSIFFNGVVGNERKPATLHGMTSLLQAMADSEAFTVLGGGDSVAIAQELGFADEMDYCSTGGGATLTYLSGQPLPGLKMFIV